MGGTFQLNVTQTLSRSIVLIDQQQVVDGLGTTSQHKPANIQWCIESDDDDDVMCDDTRVVINDARITMSTRSTIPRETVWLVPWLIDKPIDHRCLLSLDARCHARVCAKSSAIAVYKHMSNIRKRAHNKWLSECWSCHRLDNDLRFGALQSAYTITIDQRVAPDAFRCRIVQIPIPCRERRQAKMFKLYQY